MQAFAGRVFSADDDTPAAAPVVVLAYHAWQGVYGGDPAILGATLVVEGHPFTVAGVTPPVMVAAMRSCRSLTNPKSATLMWG